MLAPLALAALLAAAPDPHPLLARGQAGADAIGAAAISAHIRFLADDLLEGRAPGSRGHAIGEAYVATQLAALGIAPAGENGTFFQDVPLRAWKVDRPASRLALSTKGGTVPLESEKDYLLLSDGDVPRVDLTASLAFAGYGVTAPEYGWDDLAGVDLRGKVAVVLAGAPGPGDARFFPGVAHAVAADTRAKLERLQARGAVGVVVIWTPDFEKKFPWTAYSRAMRSNRRVLLAGGRPVSTPIGLPLRAALTGEAFDRLLAATGEKVRLADLVASEGRRHPARAHLTATATAHVETALRDHVSRNVVGRLAGADPALAAEHVLFTAHLDHLGVGEGEGDVIYNGAMDNAAGVGLLIEMARAFTRLPERPRRSVLFAAVTGEESGLLGSEYLARRPPVPLPSIVADVNLDGTPFQGPLRDLVAVGADESTLGRHVTTAAAALGLLVSPDPFPEQVLLIRSDQWSLIQHGVPAVFPLDGMLDETGSTARKTAASERWWKERYHKPTDEWDPSYDFEAMALFGRAVFLTGLSVADDPERPRWNARSYFVRYAQPGGAATAGAGR